MVFFLFPFLLALYCIVLVIITTMSTHDFTMFRDCSNRQYQAYSLINIKYEPVNVVSIITLLNVHNFKSIINNFIHRGTSKLKYNSMYSSFRCHPASPSSMPTHNTCLTHFRISESFLRAPSLDLQSNKLGPNVQICYTFSG